MTDAPEVLVFDTSPLQHFALADWLGVLKALVGGRRALIPDVVVDELRHAQEYHSQLGHVLGLSWIEHRDLREDEEIYEFARFSSLLVKGDRNRGEAGVLALAKVTGATAVVDDGAGRRAARANGVVLKPTLALLCEAIRADLLTVKLVAAVADDLLATDYRLPLTDGFEAWWAEHQEHH